MPENLLEAKIIVPPTREPLVARPGLLARLDAGAQHGVTLVSAPAGYGKTTLVSDWLHRRTRAPGNNGDGACWLALEPPDNNEVRFLAYLVAALQRAAPTVGHGALAMNAAAQPPPLALRLGALVNDLTTLAAPLTLVMDDYHVMTATAVHDALRFLVDHRPPTLHLVILTREDPPLALPRLRARQQLTELRLRDLRFSVPEAAKFLRGVARLELVDEAIRELTEQTEGWIAGLQLAAITHFLSTGTWEPAMDLLQEVSDRMLQRGDASIFLSWAEQIPAAERGKRPAFLLQYAWALILTGNLDRAGALLEHFKPPATSGTLLADALVARAHIARARFDKRRHISRPRRDLGLLSAADRNRQSTGTPMPGSSWARPSAGPLSKRELELLALVARRRTNAEIARALFISVNTVKTHLRHIYQKLDVHDRHEAVVVARALRILD